MDFVCKTPTGDIEYYQSGVANHKLKVPVEREFGALENINDNYPKFLLTTDSYTHKPEAE
jgi:hypothetical protein